MRRFCSNLALLALILAPASGHAGEFHGSLTFQHATQAVAVPLVVHHGGGVASVQLLVAPLAAPVVVVPYAAPFYNTFAPQSHRRRLNLLQTQCHR